MNAIPYESRTEAWDDAYADTESEDDKLPRRPRRQFLNRRSAALAAVVMCAAGFYAGVRVEKGQVSSSSPAGSSSLPSGAAAALRGGPRSAQSGGSSSGGGFPGGALGGANASFGTVSSVSGNALYISDSSGNTVKVSLSRVTKISKNVTVPKRAVRPGDTVIVQGLKNRSGTLVATSVSDSGASTTSSSSSGSSSSTAAGSSAVSSLFGGSSGGAG